MEVGVWVIGVTLRLLDLLMAAVYWLRARDPRRLPPARDPLLLRSVADLAAAVRSGELSSERVVSAFIQRAVEVNPYLNAVVDERYTEALEEARGMDRRLADARRSGDVERVLGGRPLYGVPFTVKASCSLAGLSNAVGCVERAGSRATADGGAVRAVRRAGGVPLLVTNTPELCLGWETTNLLHGTTNNPYRLDCTPGGSSGGEGALLACGASPLSVSSDIAGSIRIPAAFCGLFGHKPTPGVIPIDGHIPTLADELYPRLLTVGPMCRHADDLPLLTRVMAGRSAHLLGLDEPVDMSTVTVHYMTEASRSFALIPVERAVREGVVRAARYLHEHCGAALSEKKFKALEDSVEMSISVFFSMKDMPNLLQDPANPKRDKSLVMELARSAAGCASRSPQALGFALVSRTRLFIPRARRAHYEARARALRDELARTLGARGVLLYPAHCGAAHRHGRVFARAAGVAYTMPLNVLGLPATVLPLPPPARPHAQPHALPVAIQVIAGPYQDRLCMAVAKQLELGFGGWRPPQ